MSKSTYNFNKKNVKVASVVTASATDFVSGVVSHDIFSMPEESQLSDSQKEFIRNKYWKLNSGVDRIKVFKRYPHTTYFLLHDFEAYCKNLYYGDNSDNEDTRQIWQLFLDFHSKNYPLKYIDTPFLPDFVYHSLMTYENIWSDKEDNASKIFRGVEEAEIPYKNGIYKKHGYPEFFIGYLKLKFPGIYKMTQVVELKDKINVVRNFIQSPNAEMYSSLRMVLEKEGQEFNNEKLNVEEIKELQKKAVVPVIFQYLLKKKTLSVPAKMYPRNEVDLDLGKGKDYQEVLYNLLHNHIEKGVEKAPQIDDNGQDMEIYYYIDKSKELGDIGYCICDGQVFSPSEVIKLYDFFSTADPSHYYTIFFNVSSEYMTEKLEHMQYEETKKPIKIQGNVDKNGIFILDQDTESAQLLGSASYIFAQHSDGGSFRVGGAFQNMFELTKFKSSLNEQDKNGMFLKWFTEEKQKNINNLENFYTDLFHNDIFMNMLNNTANSLYGLAAQNYELLSEMESESRKGRRSYNEVFPFELNTVIGILKEMPENIRQAAIVGTESSYYNNRLALLSGLFPCQKVMEKALENLDESIKIIHAIKCDGDENSIRIIRDNVRDGYRKLQDQSKVELEKTIPLMIKNGEIVMKKIFDYPEVMEYATKYIKAHARTGSWRGYDSMMEKLSDVNVYLINREAIKRQFSSEFLTQTDLNPEKQAGSFQTRGKFDKEQDSIIVFTGKDMGKELSTVSKIIMDLIGITDDNTYDGMSNIDQQSTFWHEVSHSIEYVLSDTMYGEKPKNVSEWMQSPDELLAMQRGNLPFIKNKLQKYFDAQIPESGNISARLSSGFVNFLRSDIIETFSWEFKGVDKNEANSMINKNIEKFENEVMEIGTNITRAEKINILVDVFTDFFMRLVLKSHVEEQALIEAKMVGKEKEKLNVYSPSVPPERYEQTPYPYAKDKFIKELEQRPDYQDFLKRAQKRVFDMMTYHKRQTKDNSIPSELRPYVQKGDRTSIMPPFSLEDLLKFLYNESSISSVNTNDLNRTFKSDIPQTLLDAVAEIVRREKTKQLASPTSAPPSGTVTPDEAEETGAFMAQMDREYGPDWVDVAKSISWYKVAKTKNFRL